MIDPKTCDRGVAALLLVASLIILLLGSPLAWGQSDTVEIPARVVVDRESLVDLLRETQAGEDPVVVSVDPAPDPTPPPVADSLPVLSITEGGTPDQPRVYDGDEIGPVLRIESVRGASHIVIRDFDLAKPEGAGQMAGIIVLGDWRGVTIRDCTVVGYDDNLNIQGRVADGIVARDLKIIGCVIRGSRQSGSTHSQGVYLDSIDGVTMRHNVIHDNGRRGSPFDHNVYGQFSVSGMRFVENVTTAAAATGAMIRGGGVIRDNIVSHNPIGLINGLNRTEITGNFVLAAEGFDRQPRDWGIALHPSRGGVIENNVVADVRQDRGNGWAIQADAPKADSGYADHYTQLGDDSGPTVIRGNRVYAWPSNPDHGPTVRIHAQHRDATMQGNTITDQPFGRGLESFAGTLGLPQTLEAYIGWVSHSPRDRIPQTLAYLRDRTQPEPDDETPAITPLPAADASLEILPGAPNADPWLRGRTLVVRLHGRHQHGPASAAEVRWTDAQGRAILGAVATPPGAVELWLRDWTTLPDGAEGHTWWAGTAGADGELDLWMERAVVGITRAVEVHYGTSGRVIHGISMGGGGALRIGWGGRRLGMDWDAVRADVPALLHSDHGDHSGVRGVDRLDDVLGRDITAGEIARLDVRTVARDRGAALPPTWISYGTADPSVSPASAVELIGVARGAGAQITVHVGEGEGHRAGQPGSSQFESGWRRAINQTGADADAR